MKARKERRVPLAPRWLPSLREAQARRCADSPLLFPSPTGRTLSDATPGKLWGDLGIDTTAHGFRSTFRDWAGSKPMLRTWSWRRLAHAVKNKAEAAYARSDLFAKRRDLMRQWAEFVAS